MKQEKCRMPTLILEVGHPTANTFKPFHKTVIDENQLVNVTLVILEHY